jgi:hypothetical protein
MPKRFALTAVLFFMLMGATAHAAYPCESKDLYTEPNAVLRSIPIRDQDGVGTCYAEATATVANFYLMKHGMYSSPVVHPIYTAYLLHKVNTHDYGANNTDTGRINGVFNLITSMGFCGRAQLELRLLDLKKAGNFKTTSEVLSFLDLVYNLSQAHAAPGRMFARFKEVVDPQCNPQSADRWLTAHGLHAISQTAVLDKLFAGCEVFKPEVPYSTPKNGTDVNMAEGVRHSLNNGNPIALELNCARSFFQHPGKETSVKLNSNSIRILKTCNNRDDGGHAIVIAGEKMMGGKCNYLIRNSWGTTWRGEGATSCSCLTHEGEYKESCTKSESKEFLGCWYKRADVMKAAVEADYIE